MSTPETDPKPAPEHDDPGLDEATDAAPAPESAPAVADDVTALHEEIAELKDKYLRVHAEMDNVRRRARADIEQRSRTAIKGFAKDLLPVLDNLSRALESVPEDLREADERLSNLLVGIELTATSLTQALGQHGVQPAAGVGAPFDPNVHQVVQEVEDPSQPAGTIVQELQRGYTLHGQILRDAMVIVSKGGPKLGEAPPPPGNTVNTEV